MFKTIKDIIAQYDTLENKNFYESEISDALQVLMPFNKEETSPELLAEIFAFGFAEDYQDKDTGWGTYYGPMAVWNNENGTSVEFPSINAITPEMIQYWEIRSWESTNPIIIARYSGLVWEFAKTITDTKPSYEIGIIYIKALNTIGNGNFFKYEVSTSKKLKRALKIAISLNNKPLIEDCKNAIISFEDRHSQDTSPGLWGYAFDLLLNNKKVTLTKEEESYIIQELEDRLGRVTAEEADKQHIDPWAAESAAVRLAEYYKKKNKLEDVKRVILKIGDAYDLILDEASAMQASGWLDHLYHLYINFEFKDEANKILLQLREIGSKVNSEMATISRSFSIPRDKLDALILEQTSGSIQEALLKIAVHYIPTKEEAEAIISNLSSKNPLSFLLTINLQDHKGRVMAKIKSLKEDLEGHIVRQISQNLDISSLFLQLVINHLVENSDFNETDVLQFIENTPAIDQDRKEIIRKGLEAYFAKNYIIAVHLIIPQIEEAIRNILEKVSGNVLKPKDGEVYQLRTFDDILRDPLLNQVLGSDFCDYFRILFTDQRGWNMRNNVCHGLVSPTHFNSKMADRVLHALLCLGLIQKI